MIPKSPQILANQARHFTISNYRMHFVLFSLLGMDQKQLVKNSSPASVAVIIKICLSSVPFPPAQMLASPKCLPKPRPPWQGAIPSFLGMQNSPCGRWFHGPSPSCPEGSYLPAPSMGLGSLEVHSRCGLDWIESCHDKARCSVRHCRQLRARTDVCKRLIV